MGCSEMTVKDMVETMEDLNAKEFVQLIKTSDMENLLKEKNFTVFLPTDDAIEDYRHDLEQLNSVDFVSYNIDSGLKVNHTVSNNGFEFVKFDIHFVSGKEEEEEE